MGWASYLLMGDFGQQLDLSDNNSHLANMNRELQARRDAATPGEQYLTLQHETDEMKLYLTALFGILIQKQLMTRDELKIVVDKIDQADGKEDGRYTGPVSLKQSEHVAAEGLKNQ